MRGLSLGFETPIYLWLLILLLPLWWFSYRALAVLGPLRRWLALLLRTTVYLALVFALAGIQFVRTSDRVTVVYLLDQSESIPVAKRQLMLDFVVRAVKKYRQENRNDRAGIIVFGREASVEIPPFEDEIPALRGVESYLGRTDATNLEAALKLAQASMLDDASRRVVIVTDGNENLGNSQQIAARLADEGIGIDVVPVELGQGSEVLVEKIDLPPQVRKGQPIEARVVISNYSESGTAGDVPGRLVVTREIGGVQSVIAEDQVVLKPGKTVYPLRHEVGAPAPYTYRARFVPDRPQDDALTQNNEVLGYTYVRGSGRVLLIESAEEPGGFETLVNRLREADIEVQVQPSNQLFRSLAELQAYEAVILAGVPRVSGDTTNTIAGFSDEQIEMLVRNTQQLGAGLMMIGGPDSLGAGGWSGTEIEKAMPVDFQIRNSKVQAVGALAIILHASEIPQGNMWQQRIATAAIDALGPADYAGVLHWGPGQDEWLWGKRDQGMMTVGPNRRAMIAALQKMTPGDMPYFDPAMKMALAGLAATPASIRHCIIISDGDPSDPSNKVISDFVAKEIKISTVAVAAHGPAESQRLNKIATATKGKYYQVNNPSALPQIFQREARRVSRPLVKDLPQGASPQIVFSHPVLEGIPPTLPPITGFVMTQTKESPLAQVLIRSPDPESPENNTVLAVWTYGLGRTCVLSTDAGQRWASSWVNWADYDKMFTQIVRWLMRPTGDTGKYDLATRVENGRIEVVVSALDKDDSFLNFLEMNASALSPDLEPLPLDLQQVAPGRYVGSLPADKSGNYFINIVPGPGQAPLTTGVTVPYSEEYRVRESNRALLASLADVKPSGGNAGVLLPSLEREQIDEALKTDPYRTGLKLARSVQDAWPLIALFAVTLFFFDVFVRRVAIDFGWVARGIGKLLGRDAIKDQREENRLRTLKAKKEAVGSDLERRRAATRFEPDPEIKLDPGNRSAPAPDSSQPSIKKSTAGGLAPGSKQEKSYTERLLDAKKAARKQMGNQDDASS